MTSFILAMMAIAPAAAQTTNPGEIDAIWVAAMMIGSVLAVVGALLISMRRKWFSELKQEFESLLKKRESEVRFASSVYRAEFSERAGVDLLADLGKETSEVYRQAAQVLDRVLVTNAGMRMLHMHCRGLAEQARWWKPGSLQRAFRKMDEEFVFGTEHLGSKKLLMSKEEFRVAVWPKTFVSGSSHALNLARPRWKRVQELVRVVETPVRELYSRQWAMEMFNNAQSKRISLRWFSHPLLRVDANEDRFWRELDELRTTDPIALEKRLEELVEVERLDNERYDELLHAAELVEEDVIYDTIEVPAGIKMDPMHDPRVTQERAVAAADKVLDMIGGRASLFPEVLVACQDLRVLVERLGKQVKGLETAKQDAADKLREASAAYAVLLDATVAARRCVDAAEKRHANQKLRQLHELGMQFYARARQLLREGERQNEQLWYFEAKQRAEKARDWFFMAKRYFDQAQDKIKELDAMCEELSARMIAMGVRKVELERAMAEMGISCELDMIDVKVPGKGPVDIENIFHRLNQCERMWECRVWVARAEWNKTELERASSEDNEHS